MKPTEFASGRPDLDSCTTAEMARYGIVRKPVDYFHYKSYRYTSLQEAIAQAKRDVAVAERAPSRGGETPAGAKQGAVHPAGGSERPPDGD